MSGVCWSIVYIELIRQGLKDKTYAMPLFALGLNFAWEVIYFSDKLALGAFGDAQTWVNLVWATLDAVIVCIYFKYGREYFPAKAQKYFVPFSTLAFASCFVFQFAFYLHFPPGAAGASGYSAFTQNVIMSVLFLTMLISRGNTRGQTRLMAVSKWIGTLAPTILFGVVTQFSIFIILMGALCSLFDIIYLIVLCKWKSSERSEQNMAVRGVASQNTLSSSLVV
ncbi:MAG: hypothetical protein LBQ98_02555 [Nitrososphaerota archaeon]|nr:hypothetical protein [Nitrososphaerota archaeon]